MNSTPMRGKPLLLWLIPRSKFVKRLSLALFITALIGFISIQFWIHSRYLPILQRNPHYESWRNFWNAPLDFTEDDLVYAHVPSALNLLYHQLKNSPWNTTDHENFLNNYFDPRKRDSIGEFDMSILKPLLDDYIQDGLKISKQIEEILKTVSPGDRLPLYIQSIFFYLYERDNVAYILSQQSDSLASQNHYDEAFRLLISCFPLRLQCPRQSYHAYRDSLDNFNRLTRSASLLVQNVSSSVYLKSGLETMNRLEPLIFQDVLKDATKWAVLDDLREYYFYSMNSNFLMDRYKFNSMDFTPGKPYRYYLKQIAKRKIPEMRFWRNIPFIGYYYLAGRKLSEEELAGLFRPFDLSDTLNDYFYLRVIPEVHINDFRQSFKDTSVEYDRLRLKIATRLYDLETGQKVKSASDLVPAYFPTEPKNRETGQPYRWNERGEVMEFQ